MGIGGRSIRPFKLSMQWLTTSLCYGVRLVELALALASLAKTMQSDAVALLGRPIDAV
jgi:hypothetical protein